MPAKRSTGSNPVTYRYKKEIDQGQSLDYGLIAEEVAEVDPNLALPQRRRPNRERAIRTRST